MFNSITIEKEVSYMGRKDIYIIEQGDKSIPITHKVGGFMHKKVNSEIKKLIYLKLHCQLKKVQIILI